MAFKKIWCGPHTSVLLYVLLKVHLNLLSRQEMCIFGGIATITETTFSRKQKWVISALFSISKRGFTHTKHQQTKLISQL